MTPRSSTPSKGGFDRYALRVALPLLGIDLADTQRVQSTAMITELLTEGIAHHAARRFGQAVERYSRVVTLQPDSGEAWRLLGVVALQTGDGAAARGLLERAIRIDAADAAAHNALGNVNEAEGQLDQAYAAYAAAYAIDRAQASAAAQARIAIALGRAAQACAIAEAAAAYGEADAGLLRSLGAARLTLRDYVGAAHALIASLQISEHADAYANLGAALIHLHRVGAAIRACEAALAHGSSHAGAANTLGIARKAQGAFSAALTAFERAIDLGSEEAHINLGTTRLLLDDYHEGWPQYGWMSALRRASPPFAELPMWDGGPAPGRHLLIWSEQGIGDTIQMVRFLRRARALVGAVTLACPPGTIDLLRTVPGVDACVEQRTFVRFDAFDLWLPTIRLPVVFDVAPGSIPHAPYVHADPLRIRRFQPRLAVREKLRVGLVWSGSPEFAWNDLRSCDLAELAPLLEIPGVAWFALQQPSAHAQHGAAEVHYGGTEVQDGAARAQTLRVGANLVPINAEVSDFADTAAIIAQLDLVITVDTSVAHLAGALGRPTWVLLSNRPDWRWGLGGDVCPWYPTLRLFRQGDDGAWPPVVAKLVEALRQRR